jgi:hypothetical protein
MLEFVLLENRVVNVEYSAAGIAENVFNAFIGQAAHDDIGAIEFHNVFPFRTGSKFSIVARPDTAATEPEPKPGNMIGALWLTEPRYPNTLTTRHAFFENAVQAFQGEREVEMEALATHAFGAANSK